jgi:hypothetical protein
MMDRHNLKWVGLQLRLPTGRLLATVEPDAKWIGMYRVRLVGEPLTDMVNLSRAKDAAIGLVLANLNGRKSASEAPAVRSGVTPSLCPTSQVAA